MQCGNIKSDFDTTKQPWFLSHLTAPYHLLVTKDCKYVRWFKERDGWSRKVNTQGFKAAIVDYSKLKGILNPLALEQDI